MALYSDPPPLRLFKDDKPTLLVCWWITIFCTVIILLRVGGRFVRSERLFKEDKTVALALIPLYIRMGCVHVILIYGTNNAQLAGANLTDQEIHNKSIASGLVLFSRIMYAATLWILKTTILEFFKRLNVNWERSYGQTLLAIRCILVATFVAVIISDLAECQPFSHYWQVLPDPGGQCRQGYAQLLTTAICNIITDLLLVFFPVPIIIQSQMTTKRKAQLVLLFSLSLAVVGTTLYRVPHIIEDNGSQQSRSLYASVELLFATTAANALVLGSFVRDRGVKKMKFKYGSIAAGSMERSSGSNSRRPTMNRYWGSDENLVRDVGYGVNQDLRDSPVSPTAAPGFSPAPMVKLQEDMDLWQFPGQKRNSVARSDDSLIPREMSYSRNNSVASPRKVSFYDVGGLLDDHGGRSRQDSYVSGVDPTSPHSLPSPSMPAGASGVRRGSTAVLQDMGGLLTPVSPKPRTRSKVGTELQPIHQARPESYSPRPSADPTGRPEPALMDLGGLLNDKQ